MITNLINKTQPGKIKVRATALNPRWKEGTVKLVHLSIAKIWLAKGWVVETEMEHYRPKPPDPEKVVEAKQKVKRTRKTTKK